MTKMTSKPKSQDTYIRMVLTTEDGKVYANRTYTLVVDGVEYHGKTDSRGLLEKAIPEDSKQGTLILQRDDNSVNKVLELPLDIVEGKE